MQFDLAVPHLNLILQDMDQRWTEGDSEARSRCYNMVARTCARGGMLDEGLELLNYMQKSEVAINRDTVFIDHLANTYWINFGHI